MWPQPRSTTFLILSIFIRCSQDIADPAVWDALIDEPGMSVFHLAAVMSGQGEEDFDLVMNTNLKGFMALM